MMNVGQQLAKMLDGIGKRGKVENPDSDRVGKFLFKIYVWQELRRYSDKQVDLAWEMAAHERIIPPDDTLREEPGERVVAKSPSFSLFVKVNGPRELFDKLAFIEAISKNYNIDEAELMILTESCMKKSKPTLQKRVVEKGTGQ